MIDKIRDWWYVSNQKKSQGGLIFMTVASALFIGVIAWIFMQ